MTADSDKDARIQELEQRCSEQEATIRSQQNTVDALQKTNELLTDQLEEISKQLHSSNQQFLSSRGLSGTDIVSNTATHLDDSLNASLPFTAPRKDSLLSQCSDNNNNNNNSSSASALMNQTHSIRADEDDIYSSGDDIETYKTSIDDDHELLPLKQGVLKKKSENMHRYNARYVILYPSFLLYYDSCPINKSDARRRSSTLNTFNAWSKSKGKKAHADLNMEINHPKGTIYLRNYHLAIRKDQKKQRFDITFVPHVSAIAMGLAAQGVRIRFRCKNVVELTDWTDKIRTAITSFNTGFIKYDVNTDFISNDFISTAATTTTNSGDQQTEQMTDDVDQKENNETATETKPDNNSTSSSSDSEPKDDADAAAAATADVDDDTACAVTARVPNEAAAAPAPASHTRMFDVNDLRQMMHQEQQLQNELEVTRRNVAQLEHEKAQLVTDLAIKNNEVEQTQSIAQRQKENLEARMVDIEAHESALKEEIAKLRKSMAKMDDKHREQHKKLKRFKYNEDDMERSMRMIEEWTLKLREHSLQHLGSHSPPSASNKQLFEQCQNHCMALLEETYDALQCSSNQRNEHHNEDEADSNEDVKQMDLSNDGGGKIKRKKQNKHSKKMMQLFSEIVQSQLKTVINFASLQQAHSALVEELTQLKEQLAEYEEDDENTLADDALIMASMTASFF